MKKTIYGITDGATISVLVNATSLQGAANIYIKRILKEYFPDEPEKHKLNAANLQLAYESWAENSLDMLRDDGYTGEQTIPLDGMVDNWSNRFWIVTKQGVRSRSWDSINNSDQYDLLLATIRQRDIREVTEVL